MHEVRGKHRDGRGERERSTGIKAVYDGERHDRVRSNADIDSHGTAHGKSAHVCKLECNPQLETLLKITENQSDEQAAHQGTLAGIATKHHAAKRSERIGEVIQNRDE